MRKRIRTRKEEKEQTEKTSARRVYLITISRAEPLTKLVFLVE